MKNENVGLFAIMFFFTLIMWVSFANGLINSWYPITGTTSNYNLLDGILQNLFYFLPHLIIGSLIIWKYKEG